MSKNEIGEEIQKLKKERDAVILAHNYQRDDVQRAADFTGDSLELSRKAATIDCEVIVFCGVNFMAESASILSPDKTVLLPATEANCPMADMVTVESPRELRMNFPGYNDVSYEYPEDFTLKAMKERYPGVPVVAYVNTTADVKAESDYCCTSGNAVKLVQKLIRSYEGEPESFTEKRFLTLLEEMKRGLRNPVKDKYVSIVRDLLKKNEKMVSY